MGQNGIRRFRVRIPRGAPKKSPVRGHKVDLSAMVFPLLLLLLAPADLEVATEEPGAKSPREATVRGHLRKRGDAYELRTYAGFDPISGRQKYAREPSGVPNARPRRPWPSSSPRCQAVALRHWTRQLPTCSISGSISHALISLRRPFAPTRATFAATSSQRSARSP